MNFRRTRPHKQRAAIQIGRLQLMFADPETRKERTKRERERERRGKRRKRRNRGLIVEPGDHLAALVMQRVSQRYVLADYAMGGVGGVIVIPFASLPTSRGLSRNPEFKGSWILGKNDSWASWLNWCQFLGILLPNRMPIRIVHWL